MKIYEGKTKILYKTDDPRTVLIEFKDSVTALDGKKSDILKDKGRLNAEISAKIFEELEKAGISTHLIRFVKPNSILAKKLDMLKLEVICRNIAAGSFVKRFPLVKEGSRFKEPIVEFHLKSDELGDPLLAEDYIPALDIATKDEVQKIKEITRKVNECLNKFTAGKGMTLVDFKLEFGKDEDGNLAVADELNGDCMRIWDSRTGKILDKDVYRRGEPLDRVMGVYRELHSRVAGTDIRS